MIELIVVLALVGVLLWAVTTLLPMPAMWRNVIIVVAVLLVVVWLLRALPGINGGLL